MILVFGHTENCGKIPTFIYLTGLTLVNMNYGIIFFFFEIFFRTLTIKKNDTFFFHSIDPYWKCERLVNADSFLLLNGSAIFISSRAFCYAKWPRRLFHAFVYCSKARLADCQ